MSKKMAVHFSSATDDWATPQDLFDELDSKYDFEWDVCASANNTKVPGCYFDVNDNGLAQEWSHTATRFWMNPPYSEPEQPCKKKCKKKRCPERGYCIDTYKPGQIDWVRKAYEESRKGCLVVCLLPARTDTEIFHDIIQPAVQRGEATLEFIKGRIKFGGAKDSAPFPSMIVVFYPPGQGPQKKGCACDKTPDAYR